MYKQVRDEQQFCLLFIPHLSLYAVSIRPFLIFPYFHILEIFLEMFL